MLADNDGAEEPTATSSVINVVRRRAAPLVTPQRAQRMIPIAEATGHSRDRGARTLAPRRRPLRAKFSEPTDRDCAVAKAVCFTRRTDEQDDIESGKEDIESGEESVSP